MLFASGACPRPVCVLLAGLLVLSACGKSEQQAPQRPPAPVSVMTVSPQTIPYNVSFVAQTESSQQVDIVARVSGFLDKISYQEGEVVKAGQVLFQLDPKPFQAQLQAARGELQSQQARLTTATANLSRIKPLAEQNAVSQSDLDKAQGEFDAAKAAVFSAQATVTQAELNLGYTTIRSPVTGLASKAQQRQGAYVNAMAPSSQLTYVAAIDPIWVNFSVSQTVIGKYRELIAAGQLVPPPRNDYKVEVVLGGQVLPETGTINFADPSFSLDTGSFQVRAVIPNPRRELRPGMFVTANLKGTVRPDAVVVPQLAVQQGAKGHLVYLVNQAGVAEVRPVLVGEYFGEKDIVIAAGLQAGDRVIVEGMLKVVPGQPVQVAQAAAAQAGAPAGQVAAPAGQGGAPAQSGGAAAAAKPAEAPKN
jgi:membrane fusion protein (multidrug efflux system)